MSIAIGGAYLRRLWGVRSFNKADFPRIDEALGFLRDNGWNSSSHREPDHEVWAYSGNDAPIVSLSAAYGMYVELSSNAGELDES